MSSYLILVGYLVVLHLAPILNLFDLLPGGRIAVLVDSVSLLVWSLGGFWLFSRSLRTRISVLDRFVLVYLFINLFSVVMYFQPDAPSEVMAYFYGLHYVVLPMGGYFAVRTLSGRRQGGLLGWMLVLNVFLLAAGLVLHFQRPDFFTTHLAERLYLGQYTEEWQYYYRLSSYLNSTTIGTISAVTLVLFGLHRPSRRWLPVCLPIILTAVALTRQRGGMVACLLAVAYLLLLTNLPRIVKWGGITLAGAGLVVAVFLFDQRHDGVSESLSGRFTSELFDVFEERGYGPGLKYFFNWPLGAGVGATLSVSESVGLAPFGQVVDANFMRILADLGFIGLLSILAVWAAAARAAFHTPHRWGWLTLLGLIALICGGTNTLDSFYVSQSFWLLLGLLDASARNSQVIYCSSPYGKTAPAVPSSALTTRVPETAC